MKISKINLMLIAFVMLFGVVVSCKDDDKNNPDDPNSYRLENEAAIDKASIAKKQEISVNRPENYESFVKKIQQFSNKLSVEIGMKGTDNTAVSPLSVFMALSLATECADSDTRQELLDVVGITYQELSENISYLCQSCNRILDHDPERNPNNVIKSVNSIWIKDGYQVKDECINILTSKYFSDVLGMNFSETDVNKLITSYIKNETKGFLAPNLDINSETVFVLLNVVYLKEVWDYFGEDLSFTKEKYDFINYDKSTTSTKLLMGDYCMGKAVVTEKFRRARVYTNSSFSITFYVPNDGYTLDDIFTEETFAYKAKEIYSDDKYEYHTRCLFPEYKASYDADIKSFLQDLGIKKIFTSGCDFSKLTDEKVFCGKVKHVTKLEVSKSGIEGAAVTAIEMDATSAGPGQLEVVYEDFVVDRNFIYVLSDSEGVPVFTGVVKSIK